MNSRPFALIPLLCLAAAPAGRAQTPDTPAVAVVKQFLAARAAGKLDAAYALLSPNTQAQFPASGREQLAKELTHPETLKSLPPALLPVVALFADEHNTLHFKFRALGPAPDDAGIVSVRAYQVGAPLSTIKTIRVVTVRDSAAGGALRIDGEKTAMLAAPGLIGGRATAQTTAQQAASQSNLKQLSLGVIQYVQDHNETLPDADRWVDQIMPYVKSEEVFRDPAAPGQKWGYAFNRALSHQSLAAFEAPASTVMLFESAAGVKNGADTGQSVPKPGRYQGGTDYAFADGHVKWLRDGADVSYKLSGK